MTKKAEPETIRISVRNLVEFLLRSGDIDNRQGGRNQIGAMQEGSKIHRMIQKLGGTSYQAEVPLRFLYTFGKDGEFSLSLEGRADGIFENEDGFVIDEIKGTYREVDRIKQPELLHEAQAKCYGYMFASKENLSQIGIQITYCNIESLEINRHYKLYSYSELEAWFLGIMNEYSKWVVFEILWKKLRTSSLKELVFPFEYREGQKELAIDVYSTIYHEKKLFLEAPTGVGKTITTVFPSLKAIGEGRADRLFYFTAKTITRTVADETFRLLRKKEGLKFKSVLITAKEKICPMESMDCNPVSCPYAKGHYDRINDAIFDLISHEDSFHREKILEYSEKHMVCPFELCLDVSLFSDGVICDYNYLFDPHVYLKRFFGEGSTGEYLFLVDEAHNLVERGRDMYSAVLVKEQVLGLKRSLKMETVKEKKSEIPIYYAEMIIHRLEKANKEFLELKHRDFNRYEVITKEEATDLVNAFTRLSLAINKYLEEVEGGGEIRKEILDFYFDLSHFLLMWENLNDHYRIYIHLSEKGEFSVKLYCIDPSLFLRECMDKGVASVLFSATFLPIQYYKKLLGGEPGDYEVYAHSSFDEAKKGLFIARDTTSKFTERTAEQYERIADYIYRIIGKRKGNYIAFFPSYAFADRVYEIFERKYLPSDDITCILQNDHMTEGEREEFLQAFHGNNGPGPDGEISIKKESREEAENRGKNSGKHSLIGFCVMGGIFSEGIDLKGDSLIGAIIVGNGLPLTCAEREILKNYFDETQHAGFDYAYRYPGMNKVLQSAGRVIRTVSDIGIVVLLDYRFLQPAYRNLFPREWKTYEPVNLDTVESRIESFWAKWPFD